MSSSDVKDNHATEHVHGPNCHHDITPKIGRNEPCSCGRQKKFKKCCGKS